jgi:hypothetical protein
MVGDLYSASDADDVGLEAAEAIEFLHLCAASGAKEKEGTAATGAVDLAAEGALLAAEAEHLVNGGKGGAQVVGELMVMIVEEVAEGLGVAALDEQVLGALGDVAVDDGGLVEGAVLGPDGLDEGEGDIAGRHGEAVVGKVECLDAAAGFAEDAVGVLGNAGVDEEELAGPIGEGLDAVGARVSSQMAPPTEQAK